MESNSDYLRIRISSQHYFPLITEQKIKTQMIQRLKYCSFSKEPLRKPIVMCKKGYLFNREIILGIIEQGLQPLYLRHLQSKDDLKEICIIFNSMRNSEFPLLCPLTNKVLNGSNPFVLNWACGCLLYEKLMFPLASIKMSMNSVEQMKRKGSFPGTNEYKCPNCAEKFGLGELYQLSFQKKKEQKNNKKNITNKKIIKEDLPPKLGKRGKISDKIIKATNYSNPSFNNYLINLEINSKKQNNKFNFKSSLKRKKKDQNYENQNSEIRVRYRNIDKE